DKVRDAGATKDTKKDQIRDRGKKLAKKVVQKAHADAEELRSTITGIVRDALEHYDGSAGAKQIGKKIRAEVQEKVRATVADALNSARDGADVDVAIDAVKRAVATDDSRGSARNRDGVDRKVAGKGSAKESGRDAAKKALAYAEKTMRAWGDFGTDVREKVAAVRS